MVPTPLPSKDHWHTCPSDEAVARLASRITGLSEEEAAERLATWGANRLERSRPVSAWRILRNQLASVVVILLAAAALVSLLLGDHAETAAIGAVLALNTAIGFVTEFRARRAMEALLRFDAPRAAVVREGQLRLVDAQTIVPGDVVELSVGQAVPADGRLIAATDFQVTEAALTGESLPISKAADATLDAVTPLAERTNMVYKGTTIATGIARAVVTATGTATELGQIGALVAGVQEGPTPLEQRLDALGHRLVWLALGVGAVVAGLEALHGASLALVIETGIALAVAAVPEALPAVATIALAVGLRRMARRQALVRRLASVEALGSTTVICTDKTRTLTSGEMSVGRVWTAGVEFALDGEAPSADGSESLIQALEVATLASRGQATDTEPGSGAPGDPVDAAVAAAATRVGVDRQRLSARLPLLHVVPFSSERKLMAAFHRKDNATVAYVKGAPRRVIELCNRVRLATGDELLDSTSRDLLLAINEGWASRGLRVLALASGEVESASEGSLAGLTFVGFLGLTDPPAPGVKRTIAQLREAGLRTIMVTGDQRLTAETIGRELGLLGDKDRVIDGRELAGLTTTELESRLSHVGAFSRVTPRDKLAIVEALQARGEIVAMLGDGVNDAPALKKADVGVAMGLRGTDVAKEAAAIVLQNDQFQTVAAAVEEGRVIYDNIRKFVFYLFSCNLAEILVLLIAGLIALPPPILPLQILWINIVTDTLPALALAVEPRDPDVMRRPPRHPREALLSRAFLYSVALYAAIITFATLAAFLWGLWQSPGQATTMSFMALALAQIFHLGNARSPNAVLQPARAVANPYALAAVVASVGLQILPVGIPLLRDLLRLTSLGAAEWGVVLSAAAAPGLIGQAVKVILARRTSII